MIYDLIIVKSVTFFICTFWSCYSGDLHRLHVHCRCHGVIKSHECIWFHFVALFANMMLCWRIFFCTKNSSSDRSALQHSTNSVSQSSLNALHYSKHVLC